LHESSQRAFDSPLHDSIVGLICEIYVAGLVTGWTFGEFKVAGEFFEFCAWSDYRRNPFSFLSENLQAQAHAKYEGE
jgi:hypothetical protein